MLLALLFAAALSHPHHFILTPQRVLTTADIADLGARGIEVQRVLPGPRYVVRAESAGEVEADPRVKRVERFSAPKKIAPSALHAAAQAKAFTRVRLMFQDDVTFDEAQSAIEDAGGTIERPLSNDFELPHIVTARIPTPSITALAKDDRVFGIYGPPHRIKPENSVAANVSHVTPLFTAPYGLSGQGVALSLFDIGQVDATHVEFGGRVTIKITPSQSVGDHPTHVTGTMIAGGVNCQPNVDPNSQSCLAKGMAPAATVFDFDANANNGDTATMLDSKSSLPTFGVMADNNSWGYELGWQPNDGAGQTWVWWGDDELLSGYDALDTSPYDAMAKKTATLFVHSAGNDASNGLAGNLTPPWSPHNHVDNNGNVLSKETFCYSQDGSGTDCPTTLCTAGKSSVTGEQHCETTKHPSYGPFFTIGLIATAKDVIAVGAVDSSGNIAGFSSQGPARDGRVKPDLVALGVHQFSTVPNNSYTFMSGTSMSSPVITGMSALLVEQWRKTFGGQSPSPQQLKTLLIAGADDIGRPGPDYTFGWGLADAQKSVDLIIADGGIGSRIHTDDISQGQQFTTTMNVGATQNVRVVLAWTDPEIVPGPNDSAEKTLVNDLDLQVVDPSGNTVLPYVLDVNNPSANATRGENHVDNVEEVEIANAAPGTYRILVNGSTIAVGPTQRYTLVANAPLGTGVPPCTAPTTPTPLASGIAVLGHLCAATDVNSFTLNASGTGTVTIATTDTAVKMTVVNTGASTTVGANSSGTLPLPPGSQVIQVTPAGALGTNASYTIVATYPFAAVPRERSVRH